MFSEWLLSKYEECIEIIHCTPRIALWSRKMLLVRDRTRDRHIDWSICYWVKPLIFFHVLWHSKAILFIYFHKFEQMILFFYRIWIRSIHVEVLLLEKRFKSPVHLRWCWCSSNVHTFDSCMGRASTSVRVHWIWIISPRHLLTYKQYTFKYKVVS